MPFTIFTYFDLGARAGLSASDFVALLDLCEEEGSDTPGDWAAKADWEDFPIWGSPIWAGTGDPGLIRRLASIDDLQLSGVDHDGGLIPVLADAGLTAGALTPPAAYFATPFRKPRRSVSPCT